MPATGPEITRRAAIAALCVAGARAADSAQEVWGLVTTMAAALGRGDAGEFLSVCDAGMPGYAALRANIIALTAQVDAESGIDPVSNSGDGAAREIEIDWQLHLVDRTGLQRVTRRRSTIQCRCQKRGRKWKMVSIEPAAFFAPPSA